MQGVGITLRNQARDTLVETQRWAQIAVQHAFPVIQILPAQRKIEAVGVARGLHIGYGSAFAQHLQNGIAGHEMNQKEHKRDDQPDHWQRVQQAEGEISKHLDSRRQSVVIRRLSFAGLQTIDLNCPWIVSMRLPDSVTRGLRIPCFNPVFSF